MKIRIQIQVQTKIQKQMQRHVERAQYEEMMLTFISKPSGSRICIKIQIQIQIRGNVRISYLHKTKEIHVSGGRPLATI